MARPDPRRSRALLAAWLAASFALSAATDLRLLAAASLGLPLLLPRGALRHLARVARTALPVAAGLALASALFARAQGAWPPAAPLLALVLRACALAFLALAVLARADLPGALAPWPAASRLLVLTLAQVHALRLLARESRLGLESRLLRRPRGRDVARGAGGITAALLTLSARNARDVADALRARGF